jgi:hypothetical protein
MDTFKTFKTKEGFCHVAPEKIILTRDGVIGNVSEAFVGNSIAQILIIYGIALPFLTYAAYQNYERGHVFMAFFFGGGTMLLVYNIFKSRNYSATPIINRNTIRLVTYHPGRKGLTRSRLEVDFDSDGKLKKRLIILSGMKGESDKALEIMREEKLLR